MRVAVEGLSPSPLEETAVEEHGGVLAADEVHRAGHGASGSYEFDLDHEVKVPGNGKQGATPRAATRALDAHPLHGDRRWIATARPRIVIDVALGPTTSPGTRGAASLAMKTRHAVVFVDHQEARVFHIQSAAVDVFHPHHHIPRHARGGAETKTNPADQKHFFHDVVAAVADAAEILVVGPGSAKLELVKYIDEHAHTVKPKLVGVETVDHPTDPQILAFARKRFAQIDRMILGTVLAIGYGMTTRVSDVNERERRLQYIGELDGERDGLRRPLAEVGGHQDAFHRSHR